MKTKMNKTPWQLEIGTESNRPKVCSSFLKFPRLALFSLCVTGLPAQTVVPSGTATVQTQQNGETLQVNAGTSVSVNGAPAIVLGNSNSQLNNQGTLATQGVTSTVDSAANNTTINNQAGGRLEAASRVVDITAGNGATLNNAAGASIVGTGDQRNGTVYADDDTNDYTINNDGLIDAGAGNQGAGVSLSLSATGDTDADITNTGTIAGRGNASAGGATAGDGIRLETVRVGGALGANTGTFEGTITNSGDITSEGASGTTAGIRAVNGVSFQGTLNNEAGGTISGVQNGLYFGNAVPSGGADHTGGVVNNEGTISSGSRALNIDGTGLTVNNSGEILGTGVQRNGTAYSDGTATDFTLNNSGTIDAVVEGSGFAAEIGADGNAFTIDNSGTIQGRGTVDAADGLRVGNPGNIGVATVDITNSGLIDSESTTGTTAGVRFVNGISFEGEINNSGTISGVQNGLYFGNPVDGEGADHSNGVVNNLEGGVISSGSRAVNIDGIGLTVNNAGQILGTDAQRNGTVYSDGTATDFTLNNSGTIDAVVEGSGFAAEIGADGNAFTIDNSGTIQGRGTVNNADGLRVGNAGNIGLATVDITNSGVIDSESTTGTTAGVRFVNGISFEGEINNSGTISGVQNGLYFGNPVGDEGADHSNGVVNNLEEGVISSGSRAVNIDGIGLTVNNAGQILGTDVQRNGTVYSDGTATDFTLNNSGTIDAVVEGSGFAAEIGADGNAFTIDNSGTIQGRGTVDAADGLRVGNPGNIGVATVDITNSGLIDSESTTGTTAGVRFVNGISFEGEINNSGTISGVQNGLYFGNPVEGEGADHSNGVVNNLEGGVISSGSRAVNIDGIGLTVNNAGEILGTGDQRNGTVYFDGTATDATFRNSATGVVDAGEGNQGSGISIQADPGSRSHLVENNGLVQGRGAGLSSGESAGVRVFGANTANTFTNVDIINGSGGTIASETSAGILLEGVTSTGRIENSGTISGATAAIDTRTALGDITIDQLDGRLEGGVLTGAGNDVLNLGGNSVVTQSIDLGAGNNVVNILTGANVDLLTSSLTGDLNVDGSLGLTIGAPVAVTGSAQFDNASELVLNVEDVASLGLGSSTILLTATEGITNNGLSLVDTSVLTDFVFASSIDTLQVEANLANLDGLFEDSNITSFASALQEGLVAGNDSAEFVAVTNALDNLDSPAAFEGAAAGVLPELSIGVTRELFDNQSHVFNAIESRLANHDHRNSDLWFQTFGRFASRDGGSEATDTGYDSNSFGFLLGYDQKFSDSLTGGLAIAYSNINVDAGSSDIDIDAVSLNLYAAYTQGDAYLRGALAYTFGSAEADRFSSVGNIESDFDVDQFSFKLQAGVDRAYGKHVFSPFVGLEFGNASQDSFTESGGLNLAVSADDVAVLELGVGLGYSTNFLIQDTRVSFTTEVGYYYDLLDEERSLSASFAGGESFGLRGESASAGSFEVNAAFGINLNDATTLSFGYEGEFGSDFDSHTGFARVGFQF